MNDNGASAGLGIIDIIGFLIPVAIFIFILASIWRVFTKAGQPGWACIVPIYNIYVLTQIAGKPGWWVILFFIPIVGIVISIIVMVGVAQNFGKGVGFALGLIFLPFIFYPILAFGDATYGGAPAPA